jgi:pimeloyl-ACP methyl ester carboxylesterase
VRSGDRHRGGNRQRQALWFFTGLTRPPEATPYDGDDPYGNPELEPEWLRIDWRQHLRWIELDGARINYAQMGPTHGTPRDDRPLILVHGLSGCWRNWLENIPHFARTRRVVALDLPGFGESPLPEWEISIPGYGRLVHQFCTELGLAPAVLVGNSMGGFIAAEAATMHPDLVDMLVLVSAAGITHARMRKEPAEMAGRMAAAAAPLLFRLQEGSMRRPGLRYAAFRGVFHAPQRLRPELLWEQYHGALDAPGFLPAITALVGYDFTDRLEQIADPTLIVWGRNDRIVSAQDAYGFARHLRNSRTVIFDRTGHVPMLERPVRFNALLEDFLAGKEVGEEVPKAVAEAEAETVR